MLPKQLKALQGSPTGKFFAMAKEREAEGYPVIHLEIGQPDFQPLPQIIDSTIRAITEGKTAYTVSKGIPELRRAIAEMYEEDWKVVLDPLSEILCIASGKLAVLAAIYAVIDRGDPIMVQEPYWVSYPAMTHLVGGKFFPIPMDDSDSTNFGFNTDAIMELVSENKPKAMIVNHPNNPTGHILTQRELTFLKDLIEDHDIAVVSDEIYSEYSYLDSAEPTLLKVFPEWSDKIIVVNGFSKTFSMTGYRLGYTVSNPTLAEGILKFIQATTTCPASFAQWAGVTALKHRQEARKLIRELFPNRRKVLLDEVKNTPGLSLSAIDGAFYGFIKYDYTEKPAEQVTIDLLMNANVAVIPGTGFGESAEGYFRVAFSRSENEIKTAFSNIREFIKDQ
ncbi:MAG: pyridoxal phosphate-dependent aminotransferase [Candidatus Thorarchaeota archaeon]